jgi:L-2-hydroxyglutarate oxidase LhgO
MDTVETLVIGAGVVGLACARALALAGREVVVVEQAGGIGQGVSSRNSEVIHAGIYYPAGSLKALHCVRGKHRLYRYCEEHGIDHRRCGKLIVATRDDQITTLEDLKRKARANGVDDLQWLDAAELAQREPALSARRALWSPSSGIVDSHALMLALQGDLEHAGGMLALDTRVLQMETRGLPTGAVVHTRSGPQGGADAHEHAVQARQVVNAAGLHAVALARTTQPAAALRPYAWPQAHYARGRYLALTRPAPFTHLVYPVPEPGGLGVHLTLDLAGQARFGPDVQWMPEAQGASAEAIDRFDYAVDDTLRERFAREIRAYWPGLPADALVPAYSGIRPKLSGPGEVAADFVIAGPAEHGQAGVVHLMGIESPGLTSALSIAEAVCGLLDAAKTDAAHR